jgi:RNA polymerase sigma-70 factor (ECF subfamily)
MADAAQLTLLLQASASGDQRAFQQLYQSSSSHLFALLVRMLKRRDWAEEALQDCYLKIWQKSESYEPQKGAPMTWLMTIARYRALDLLRMKRPEVLEADGDEHSPDHLGQAPDPGQDPHARAVESEGLGMLERCMQGLQEEQRASVLLAYYEGYTHLELAKRLKAPLGTVKSWVRRGLQHLRECLEATP